MFVSDLISTKSILDLNWWSNEEVILARGTGAVTISTIKSLANLLGNQPEWFEPAPKLSEVHNGGFLGLEVKFKTSSLSSRGGVAQWVARLTHNVEVVGSSPIKGPRCFLEQETLPLLLSTGWIQESIRALFHNRTKIN